MPPRVVHPIIVRCHVSRPWLVHLPKQYDPHVVACCHAMYPSALTEPR